MNLSRMMIDRMYIVGRDGNRAGPFKTRFGSDSILVFLENLGIAEGDRIIRPMFDGSEQAYVVESFAFNPAKGKIPAHFSIRIAQASGAEVGMAATAGNTAGELAADPATSGIAPVLQSLSQAIAASPFPAEKRHEAEALLRALLDNEVVASIVGRAV